MNILLFIYCLIPFALGVPSGKIIAKLQGIDIQSHGSGNTGAANMHRTLGWKYGLLTLLIDVSKSYLVVKFLSEMFYPIFSSGMIVPVSLEFFRCAFAVALILGNVFSPFLRFTGGKGIATAAGAILGIAPLVLVVGLISFGMFLFFTEIVSLSSIVAIVSATSASLVFYFLFNLHISAFCFSSTVFLVILWTHRKNLARLQNGTEPKFILKKKNPSS